MQSRDSQATYGRVCKDGSLKPHTCSFLSLEKYSPIVFDSSLSPVKLQGKLIRTLLYSRQLPRLDRLLSVYLNPDREKYDPSPEALTPKAK